jgi:rRNA maturation endonuclease Nob1
MTTQRLLLCKQCRYTFRLSSNQGLQCPRCGGLQVEDAPAWAPLGSGPNIFDNSEWEYECQECHQKFKMPIPQSPAEEKARSCRLCGASHIHHLNIAGGEPLYCG